MNSSDKQEVVDARLEECYSLFSCYRGWFWKFENSIISHLHYNLLLQISILPQ